MTPSDEVSVFDVDLVNVGENKLMNDPPENETTDLTPKTIDNPTETENEIISLNGVKYNSGELVPKVLRRHMIK